MIIYIGADHRGFQLKEILKKFLQDKGYTVKDFGNDHYDENDDYPDFASLVASEVSRDFIGSRGILICGSGVGVNIVADKFLRVRSVLAISPDHVLASRNDDDTNILALAADFLTGEQAKQIAAVWLLTPFSNNPRHKRRIEKIYKIESASRD